MFRKTINKQKQYKQMQQKIRIKCQHLQQLSQNLFNLQIKLTEKIKAKRYRFLLDIPLFSLIYQKKGSHNFNIIVDHITIKKFGFGEIVYRNNQNRTFNHILHGTVMLFSRTKNQEREEPKFFKKYRTGEYFGEKMQFGREEIESARSVSLSCYLLQLDLKHFYKTFSGHFKYSQLNDQVNFLQSIWLFNRLKTPYLQRILLSSQKIKYKRGHILFKQKDFPSHLMVILHGEITLMTNKQGKYKSYCIYSKGQVCGIDQILTEKPFDCVGICTSDYTQIMNVDNSIVTELAQKDVSPEILNSRQKLSTQLKDRQFDTKRLSKSVMSIHNSLQKARKKPQQRYGTMSRIQQTRKSTKDITTDVRSHIKTQTSQANQSVQQIQPQMYTRLDQMKILNELFQREVQLKYPNTRTIRLKFIRQGYRETLYSRKRISSYINKECTYDKQLIVNYLQKKEKIYQNALKKELTYQSKHITSVPELKVDKSSAVKTQKRKLKYSRRMLHSSLAHM